MLRTTSSRVVLAVVVAAMIVAQEFRGNIIAVPRSLNPDEAELMAAGRRAALSITPFDSFTTNTYGPVSPWVLGLAHRFGLPLTVPVAHLLSAWAVGVVCAICAWVVWRRWNILVAAAVITPVFVHWAKGFYSSDFITLSTELLPLVILVAGCAIAFTSHPLSMRRAIVSAVVLGAAAWTKYQVALIVGVALLALIVKMIASGHRIGRSLIVGIVAPLSVMVLMVVWALLGGVPLWKILEGPSFAFSYATTGGLSKASPSVAERFTQVRSTVEQFHSFIPLASLLTWSVVANQWTVLRTNLPSIRSSGTANDLLTRVLAILAVVSSIVSLMVLVPVYPHYAYLFIAGMVLSTFLVASIPAPAHAVSPLRIPPGSRLALGTMSVSVLALWATVPIVQRDDLPASVFNAGARTWKPEHFVLSQKAARVDRIVLEDGSQLSGPCPPRSRVLAWGWSPELYSQYDWIPATRYVTNPMQFIGFTSNTHGYRARLLAEFRSKHPVCVIDASAMFPFFSFSLDGTWSGFASELDYSYNRINAVADGAVPVTVWILRGP